VTALQLVPPALTGLGNAMFRFLVAVAAYLTHTLLEVLPGQRRGSCSPS
jgi:hypothetical protein